MSRIKEGMGRAGSKPEYVSTTKEAAGFFAIGRLRSHEMMARWSEGVQAPNVTAAHCYRVRVLDLKSP